MLNGDVFWHCMPTLLGPGAMILPGNYGRVVSLLGERHQLWEREQTLERVRQSHYPRKPSRLRACFVLESSEVAEFYRRCNAPTTVIVRVRVADPSLPQHIGDFNCVQPMPRRAETMDEIAHHYWRYSLPTSVAEFPGLPCREVLTASALVTLE